MPTTLLLCVDNGNAMGKYAAVVNGELKAPFKVPSVYKTVEEGTPKVVTIGRNNYIYGEQALRGTRGTQGSTLEDRDKVKNLHICVSSIISKLVPQGGEIDLSIVVSNPFASPQGNNAKLSKEVLRALKNIHKFQVEQTEYSITVKTVGVVPEGQRILELMDEHNASLDLGQGTLLAAFLTQDGIQNLALNDGQLGGCNLILNGMLQDDGFLSELRTKGFTAPPSAQKLATMLSNQTFEVRGVNFKRFLKPQLKQVKTRIENASRSISSQLALADPDVSTTPSIVFIGGGAALLKEVLPEEQLAKWCAKFHLTIPEHPDYQTVVTALKLLQNSPDQFLRVDVAEPTIEDNSIDRQIQEVTSHGAGGGGDRLSSTPAFSTTAATAAPAYSEA